MEISQYSFQDNLNLPRILDSLRRDFDIDAPLDYVIEQVGQCLRLIGKKAFLLETSTMCVVNGQIKLPCYVDRVDTVRLKNQSIPFRFKGTSTVTFNSIFNKEEVEVTYYVYQNDENGFPLIATEEEYYACYHWVLYQHFLRLFAKGLGQEDKLQYFENLKNRYILQAKAVMTNSELQGVVDMLYSTYNRTQRYGNSPKHR